MTVGPQGSRPIGPTVPEELHLSPTVPVFLITRSTLDVLSQWALALDLANRNIQSTPFERIRDVCLFVSGWVTADRKRERPLTQAETNRMLLGQKCQLLVNKLDGLNDHRDAMETIA